VESDDEGGGEESGDEGGGEGDKWRVMTRVVERKIIGVMTRVVERKTSGE